MDKVIFFADGKAAEECRTRLAQNLDAAVISHQREIQDITRERDEAINRFSSSKVEEVAPLLKKETEISNQQALLNPIVNQTKLRAAEEQVLGKPIASESSATATEKQTDTIDWARVVQTNLTRLGAVAIMFFLVGILVPQYRYNIRMAGFYDARADSVRLASKVESLGEIAAVMTPNIDFGKAPVTPWEQIVEVIKAARGDK